ncbi:SseB family protein [Streptomyces sp. NPDC101165]|uniref:SseB family protein n=1 Tax=Streptomyces sp. NPDC101165 TaxID=3366119 RepID=UPI003829B070
MGSAEPTGSAGATDETGLHPPRSALADIAEQTVVGTDPTLPPAEALPLRQPPPDTASFATAQQPARSEALLTPQQTIQLHAHQRKFRMRLGEFRRRRVLVPYGENGAALTVEMSGARWLLVFTDEVALARYARSRGEGDRSWRYRAVWGAAVLDAGVPAVAGTGLPCGVLVDAGDGERGLVLPPVVGIVPQGVAVDGPERGAVGGSGTGTRTRDVVDMDSGVEAG